MTKSSLSNSLNSSGGTFNSNSSLNSTPSVDRYAALKDLDQQLRESKTEVVTPTEPAGNFRNYAMLSRKLTITTSSTAVPVNPFKNPFQSTQQQSYQNWTIPESQAPFEGFGSPQLANNGFSNGFYYNHNMTNAIQPSFGKGGFGNPFVVSCR